MESAKNDLQLIDTSSEVSNQEKTFLIHGTDKIPIYSEYAENFFNPSFGTISGCDGQPPLNGIVELDEKYFGGKPRFKKRGKMRT